MLLKQHFVAFPIISDAKTSNDSELNENMVPFTHARFLYVNQETIIAAIKRKPKYPVIG